MATALAAPNVAGYSFDEAPDLTDAQEQMKLSEKRHQGIREHRSEMVFDRSPGARAAGRCGLFNLSCLENQTQRQTARTGHPDAHLVAKHCIEIDSYGISGGGNIDGIRRVVNRGINPNCEIERCTAAEKGVPHPGQSADAVVQRGRQFDFQRFAGWWLDCGLA
jgi:hypothetical protein